MKGRSMRKNKPKPGVTRPWRETRAERFTKAELAKIDSEVAAELTLMDLREARHLTQVEVAKTMRVTQSSVSKIEKQTDPYLSTLRNYVTALGGTLVVRARFGNVEKEIVLSEEQVGHG
jgi:DNA-binding XRE family transcriptional regulator